MRREAAVAALLLFLLAAVPASPASAALPACQDGQDNDADGAVDYPADPGCGGPTDPSELACDLDPANAANCAAEEPACAGLLPPGPLTATGTSGGVLLQWSQPLSGPPSLYVVYRLTLAPLALPGLPGDPVAVTVELPGRGPVSGAAVPPQGLVAVAGPLHSRAIKVAVDLPAIGVVASGDGPRVEAIATVPGGQTFYVDAEADPDGAYAYWVAGASHGCQSPASNAAVYAFGRGFPSFGPLEDCIYIEWTPPPPHPTGNPSLACVGIPQ